MPTDDYSKRIKKLLNTYEGKELVEDKKTVVNKWRELERKFNYDYERIEKYISG